MKYLSLFSGIGGFEYGIEEAWKSIQGTERRSVRPNGDKSNTKKRSDEQPEAWRDRLIKQPKNIGYSEIDKYAIQVYEKHFKHKNYGDATKINPRELPDFDLLVGGFPCQAFSIAGKRKGFDDTRGTLFFDIARILAEKKPRLVVLENVKGLLSHEGGKTFQTIIGVLTDLGYFVEWQVLNSKNFGVPQNRERVFIIGYLGGQPRRKVFPVAEGSTRDIKSKQDDSGISRTVSARFRKGVGNTESRIIDVLVDVGQGQRIRDIGGLAQTLSGLGGGQGAKTGLYAMQWRRTEKGKTARAENQKKGRDYTPFSDGHRELVPKKGGAIGTITSQAINKDSLVGIDLSTKQSMLTNDARTIRTAETTGELEGMRIRRLTPMECERLQGFPDGWTEDLSDTQRYKCLGNAVTTNVVEYVFKKLLTTK